MLLLPGSFQPLHFSHLGMAHYAEEKYKKEVVFEISRLNVDKPEISSDDMTNRLKQFLYLGRKCIVTECPTFVQKCKYANNHLGHTTFLIGSDTLSRVQDKKYYFNSEKEMERCLTIIAKSGCDFCVFQRGNKVEPHEIIASIVEYADVLLPAVSSSQLRASFTKDLRDFRPNSTLDRLFYGDTCYLVLSIHNRTVDLVTVRHRSSVDVTVQMGEEFFRLDKNTQVEVV